MIADALFLLTDRIAALFLSPGSLLSVWSLLAAGLIAAGVAVAKRRGRPVSLRAMARAMLPRHRLMGASARADIGFTVLNVFVTGALFGWAMVSHLTIAGLVTAALGTPLSLGPPVWFAVGAITIALWVAYEFAYWFDHMLSHKLPWLWAFHKVHHSAETLSPLTVFRVHPVDSIVFYNIVAVVTGLAAGIAHWLIGGGISPWTIAGTNVLAVVALMTIKHLHHSHAWIAWSGHWGRFLLSPAHHQIHHSIAPEHHDRNFGDMLGVFDWMAGTLHQPQAKREPLVFGVAGLDNPHGVYGALIAPFADAVATLAPDRESMLSPRRYRAASITPHASADTQTEFS